MSHSPGAPLPTSDLRDQLQATLTGSYTIERELGGGGMARVFVAEETVLGRKVVIKVLPQRPTILFSAGDFVGVGASRRDPGLSRRTISDF